MGVTPVMFSPMPGDGVDIGRCLARADWFGKDLDVCDFPVDRMSQSRRKVYKLLGEVSKIYRVIRLDKALCDSGVCMSHFGATFLYRDKGHLSHEGTVALGKKMNFYKMIVEN